MSSYGDQSLFMIAEGAISTNYGIMLYTESFSSTPPSTKGYVYSEGNPD